MGKILRVDLSVRTAEAVSIPPEVYEAVLAGKGLAAWYLYRNIPAGADPLGPDNILWHGRLPHRALDRRLQEPFDRGLGRRQLRRRLRARHQAVRL